MTKTQIINRIARNCKMSKVDATKVVNTFCDGISSSLKRGRKVSIAGFGSFSVKQGGGFTARNPRTGTSRKVAPFKMVHFNPSSNWNPARSKSRSKRKSSSRRRTRRY